jgi:hypothetical protein
VQGFGVGPLKGNTILLNWLDQLPKGILGLGEAIYGQNLRVAFRFGSNIIILDADDDEWNALEERPAQERSIDVWWQDDATSHLMLLFAYLMTRDDSWDGAKIRVLATESETKRKNALDNLHKTLQDVRIKAEPIIVKDFSEDTIIKHSSEASMIFLPFRLKRNQVVTSMDTKIDTLVSRLPVVAMVLASKDIELDAEPEEGTAGELAAAVDALVDSEKKAHVKEKEAEEAAKEAEEKLNEVKSVIITGSHKDLEEKKKAASDAKAQALKELRRVAKASAKVEEAALEAEKLGVNIEQKDEVSGKDPDDFDRG